MSDQTPEDAGMWTLAETAKRFGLSTRTLLRAMDAGTLPAYKPVGRILLDPTEVKAWAKSKAWEPGSKAA
jgi:excisionase family DNA binding protein